MTALTSFHRVPVSNSKPRVLPSGLALSSSDSNSAETRPAGYDLHSRTKAFSTAADQLAPVPVNVESFGSVSCVKS